MQFNNKTVVVTGSTQGIGEAIAVRFGALGANVVVNGTREPLAKAVVERITAAGGTAGYFLANVASPTEADALISFAQEKFGSIDILINNAGITRDNLLMRMSEEEWDSVLNVNLKGAFNVIKSASRILLKQRGGAIVNITSVVGVMGNAGQANYAASKAGLIGLTKSAAKEFASRNIRCNAIAPGFIETPMTSGLPDSVKEKYLTAIPLGSFGKPEDIADAAVFLASDNAKYITGQVLNIDGGLAN